MRPNAQDPAAVYVIIRLAYHDGSNRFNPESEKHMFDSKMLLVILAIALVVFGTKRLRTIGSDLGSAVKGFKNAMNEGETEEQMKQIKQEKDADFVAAAKPEAEVKVPPKTNA